jgi:hypothetical protein
MTKLEAAEAAVVAEAAQATEATSAHELSSLAQELSCAKAEPTVLQDDPLTLQLSRRRRRPRRDDTTVHSLPLDATEASSSSTTLSSSIARQ